MRATSWALSRAADRALVLCVDEKRRIQALDRTSSLLPRRPGQTERRTHGHTRHGTNSLFAALHARTGKILGPNQQRHRSGEFRNFFDTAEKNVPEALDVPLILDIYGTHKAKLLRDWLAKRPRFHGRFTPTSAFWLNLVRRWFAPARGNRTPGLTKFSQAFAIRKEQQISSGNYKSKEQQIPFGMTTKQRTADSLWE